MRPAVRNGLIVVATLGVLTASAVVAARAWRPNDSLPLYEVTAGRFVHRVDAEGMLVAEQATVLSAPIGSGQPTKIAWLAREGSYVDKDEVVIRFDPTDMEKELHGGQSDRAKATQQSEQKQIEQTTTLANLGRDTELADLQLEHLREFKSTDAQIFTHNEIVEAEIDERLATKRRSHADEIRTIRGELGGVELQLIALDKRQAQLTIDKAQAGLRELEVRAPHAGIFILRRDWGEAPSIGQVAWPSMPIAEIPQLEKMKAQVFVLEADAGGVEVGARALVKLEAHPGELVEATVRRVAAVAKRRTRWSPVQYFEVELEMGLTDPEKMKPGQRVRATLMLQDLDDVLAVPRDAVFQDAEGDSIVYRRRGGDFGAVRVVVGATALGRAVIESGLQPGDVVALVDPTRSARATDENEEAKPAAPGIGAGARD